MSQIVIFGATGDLTKRKLIPALNKLKEFKTITGVSRQKLTNAQFKKQIGSKKVTKYLQGEFTDKSLYKKIPKSCIYYLATPPEFFPIIAKGLKNHKGKIIFEKPFGRGLASARKLNAAISKSFKEKDIFRLDHYLSKELIQNIFVLRFGNVFFEPVLNNKHVSKITINFSETLGVMERAAYYDKSGALRDMIQSHLLQVLSLLTMKDSKNIREAKAAALSKLKLGWMVKGQYENYTKEKNIPNSSKTETFVAMKVFVNNERWKGVPIFLTTGKKLKEKIGRVEIEFKNNSECKFENGKPNKLIIEVQPVEGIKVEFNLKPPSTTKLITKELDYCYKCEYMYNTPEAYETLLHAAYNNDHNMFASWKEIEASWKFIDSLPKTALKKYKQKSNGPKLPIS